MKKRISFGLSMSKYQIEENKSLKNLNTFGIDVSCQYFITITSEEGLKSYLNDKQLVTLPLLILGGGSNILFTNNFDGVVLKNEIKGIQILKEDESNVFLKVGAGEVWHDFVLYCIENNWGGIENLSLIPGCVGAAPMQNIGAYGVEVKDVIEEVETVEIATGNIKVFTNQDCRFGYRESIFKNNEKNNHFITAVTFKLNKKHRFNIGYGVIEEELKTQPDVPLSIKKISDAVIRIRQSKLPDPNEIGNAGSFFKNPEVEKSFAEQLQKEFPNIPVYPLSEDKVKIAAGWLIENSGWKGYTENDFGVHKNQALVLVNYKNADGKSILNLSNRIIESVYNKYKILLTREVNIL